jgi:hypothetical protein
MNFELGSIVVAGIIVVAAVFAARYIVLGVYNIINRLEDDENDLFI